MTVVVSLILLVLFLTALAAAVFLWSKRKKGAGERGKSIYRYRK